MSCSNHQVSRDIRLFFQGTGTLNTEHFGYFLILFGQINPKGWLSDTLSEPFGTFWKVQVCFWYFFWHLYLFHGSDHHVHHVPITLQLLRKVLPAEKPSFANGGGMAGEVPGMPAAKLYSSPFFWLVGLQGSSVTQLLRVPQNGWFIMENFIKLDDLGHSHII